MSPKCKLVLGVLESYPRRKWKVWEIREEINRGHDEPVISDNSVSARIRELRGLGVEVLPSDARNPKGGGAPSYWLKSSESVWAIQSELPLEGAA